MARGVICSAVDAPLDVVDLDVSEPRADELRVRMLAAGVCGTDVSVQHGTIKTPLPSVLGHQGVGEVVGVGDGVTGIAEGDRVVIAAMPQCGRCGPCRGGQPFLCELSARTMITGALLDDTLRARDGSGREIHQLAAVGTFASETVVPVSAAVPIGDALPDDEASILGCGVITGAGAALNTADISEGDTVAIIGAGIVGLSALQGAVLRGATRLISIDLDADRLALARRLGATDTIDAAADDPLNAVRELTGGGADVVIDAVGIQTTTDQAIRMARNGGEVVFVGAGGVGVRVNIAQFAGLLMTAKTLKGCLFGSADIHRDIPMLAEQLNLGEMVSATFALDQAEEAFRVLDAREVMSAVLTFG